MQATIITIIIIIPNMAGITKELLFSLFFTTVVFVVLLVLLVVLFSRVVFSPSCWLVPVCELSDIWLADDCEPDWGELDCALDCWELDCELLLSLLEDDDPPDKLAEDEELELASATSDVVTSSGPCPPSWPGWANAIPETEMIKINVSSMHKTFFPFILPPKKNKKIKNESLFFNGYFIFHD